MPTDGNFVIYHLTKLREAKELRENIRVKGKEN